MPGYRDQGDATRPSRLIALSFVGTIVVGAVLLALPVSHADGTDIGPLDALFTSTSAVCVTGLVVVDTGSAFSRFGQTVILVLFQLGGLGILTLGALLSLATGRRMGFGMRQRLQAQVSALDVGSVVGLLKAIVSVVVVVEILGTLVLLVRFVGLEGAADGLFSAVFHAVSAFNNAGFGLYPDSLSRFVTDPLVNLTIIALLVIGGLGFVVVVNLAARYGPSDEPRSSRPRLSLHTKMALSIMGFLLVVGTLVIMVLEWANPLTLGELNVPSKLLASLFQAATPRTAGFNTLDYTQMETPSLVFTVLLMFIGGNPGSTAGGIKTVTFFVLAISVWNVVRRGGEPSVFGRRLAEATVVRAGAIGFGGVMLVGAALTLLTITDRDLGVLPLLFETVSAFGTVGLSLGITADLSAAGKVVIIVLMYLGRIGFMTFALALVTEEPDRDIRYPAEDVVIG